MNQVQEEAELLLQENEKLLVEKAAATEELLATKMYLASFENVRYLSLSLSLVYQAKTLATDDVHLGALSTRRNNGKRRSSTSLSRSTATA